MAKVDLIETALFDIAFGCEEDAFEQQAELGLFIRRELLPVVDELFSESTGGDGVIRIDTLEVDLGVVNYSEYQDELPRRLREELRTILMGMRFSGEKESTNGNELVSHSSNERQQIEHFLLYGYLPWYSTIQGKALEAALSALLTANTQWLPQFIARTPSPANIVARLAWQFSTELPLALVEQLSPAHGAMAAALINELKLFWRDSDSVPGRPAVTLESLVRRFWYRVMEALLGTGRLLSTQLFFERIMGELFQHDLGLQQSHLADLIAAEPATATAEGQRLNRLLRQLLEASNNASTGSDKAVMKHEPASADEGQLRETLVEAITGGAIEQLNHFWPRLVNEEAPLLKSVLRQYGQQSRVRHRIAFEFPEGNIGDIVRLIEPVEHSFVTAVVDHLQLIGGEQMADAKRDTLGRKQLWEFSLGYLLVERGSRFNRRIYLGSLVRQMAAHDNMSYRQTLAELTHNVKLFTGANPVVRQMQQLLLELGQEFAEQGGVEDESLLNACSDIDLVRGVFEAGAMGRIDEAQITSAIGRLSQRHPWLLLQLYRQLQAGVPAWRAALNRLSAPLLQQFVSAFLRLMQGEDLTGRSDLLDAIRANASRAINVRSYYRQLLTSLLAGEMIDFDAIMQKSSAATDEPVMSAAKSDAQTVVKEEENPIGAESDTAFLRHYLLTDGELSPQSQAALIRSFELIAQGAPQALSLLLAALIQNSAAVARLIQLLPERLLARCLPLLRMSEPGRLLQCAGVVTSACYLNELVTEAALLPQLKWQFIFHYLGESGGLFNERDFTRRYVEYLAAQTRQSDSQKFRAHLSQQLVKNILPSTRDLTLRIIEAVTKDEAPSRQDVEVREEAELPAASTPRNKESDQPPLENIYITNAGLVLAAPYLPRLLQLLQLMDNGAFINRDAAVRAAHLLQFLVNGQSASPEYLLPLNKLLCGIKGGTPVELSIEISADEIKIIEGLLQGMIQNWKVLGNTSIAGLRESFLQREGRLQLKDDAWHLLVEPRSFDMLLDQLPWGYSTIKYPWMERVVYVDWR